MRFANTVEFKNKTNKILREVMEGKPVIITLLPFAANLLLLYPLSVRKILRILY